MQDIGRLTIYAFVIMENRLYIIADAENLEEEIRSFQSFTSRKIIDALKEQNQLEILKALEMAKPAGNENCKIQIWQEEVCSEKIADVDIMQEKIEYIHYDPVRRGYVDEPADWRYSSARNYAGHHGLIEVDLVSVEPHNNNLNLLLDMSPK